MPETAALPELPQATRSSDGPTVRRRPAPALAAGLGVAALVAAARAAGQLDGFLALVVMFLLVVAVPSSQLGARRLLLAAGWAAGLVPALWWWDLPLGPVGRAGLVLAVLAGSLTTVVLWHGPAQAGRRARLLLPRWRAVDLTIAGAAAFAALATRGLLSVRDGAHALAALMPAWDASAHTDMVLMARRAGAAVPSLAPPSPDDVWKFADYPQGFHTIVASLVELLGSAGPGPVRDELVRLVHAQGLVLAAVPVVLVAGLCALPTAPRRPVAVTLAAAGISGVFLLGPGASAYSSGFPNFVVGCAMAAAAVLVALALPRVAVAAPLLALVGLVVGVAHSWVPLLALAIPAVGLVAVPARGVRWGAPWRGARSRGGLLALAAVLTAGGVLVAVEALRSLSATQVLVIPGGIAVPPAGQMVALGLAAVALPLASSGPGRSRTPWLAAVPVAGALAVAALGALQLRQGGPLSYYFWKLALGVTLVAVVVLAAAVVARRPRPASSAPSTSRRWLRGTAVALACLALLEVHGLTGRSTGSLSLTEDQVTRAEDLLRAADVVAASGAADVIYVRADGAVHPLNAQQWLLTLTGTWTLGSQATADVVMATAAPAEIAARALEEGAVLVVAPQDVAALGLTSAPEGRVLSWD